MKARRCGRQAAQGIVMVLMCFCFIGTTWADDFSADFIATSQSQSRMPGKGKIYMRGQLIRMEYPQAITIARPDKGMVWILMPGQNMYMEQPYQPPPGMETWAPEMEKRAKKVGTESVSGLTCTKYEMQGYEGTVYYWVSKKIDFPVKIEDTNSSMLLENIKIGKVSGDLFELPSGYQKFSMPSGGTGMPGGRGFPLRE
jgi:hypothetical protein